MKKYQEEERAGILAARIYFTALDQDDHLTEANQDVMIRWKENQPFFKNLAVSMIDENLDRDTFYKKIMYEGKITPVELYSEEWIALKNQELSGSR